MKKKTSNATGTDPVSISNSSSSAAASKTPASNNLKVAINKPCGAKRTTDINDTSAANSPTRAADYISAAAAASTAVAMAVAAAARAATALAAAAAAAATTTTAAKLARADIQQFQWRHRVCFAIRIYDFRG